MKRILILIACIAGCIISGGTAGRMASSGRSEWLFSLNTPSFNPPAFVFFPVWTLLYILMGYSFYLILTSAKSRFRNNAIFLFLFQLLFNLSWNFLFFKFHLIGLAFLEILMLWISIIAMIIAFFRVNKTAAYLQIPYLLWISFASILNGGFWYLN